MLRNLLAVLPSLALSWRALLGLAVDLYRV